MRLWEGLGVRRYLLALLPFVIVLVPATQAATGGSPSTTVETARVAETVAVPPVKVGPPVPPPAPAPPPPPAPPAPAAPPVGDDPATWPDRRLAAQLVLAGYDMSRTDAALPHVREGLGGVILFGAPPADLAARIARLKAQPGVVPFVASDEEGGKVQRLAPVLGALPSAGQLGRTRSAAQVRDLAAAYGAKMAGLGVDMDLGPVADIAVGGYYMSRTDRVFSGSPTAVGTYVGAWQAGMRSARVAPVVKHWPGHGQAVNTHDRAAATPPLAVLEKRDLLPFAAAVQAGVPAVMVGHLMVPGLTEKGLPATLSPSAYRYLRARAGDSRLLMTDSLSMGAIRKGLGLTPAQAAVRALVAGADAVLVDPGPGPRPVVDAVTAALADGGYPRAAAVASARRMLAVKRTTNLPLPATGFVPAAGAAVGLEPTFRAVVHDRVGGLLEARFQVRTAGSPTWDVLDGASVKAASGSRAEYRLGPGRVQPGRTYEWTARACNAAGLCAPLGPLQRFTTVPG